MNIKKLSAIILSLVLIFSLTACQKNDKSESTQDETSVKSSQELSSEKADKEVNEAVSDEAQTDDSSTISSDKGTSENGDSEEKENSPDSSPVSTTKSNESDNPAEWSKEKVIDFYKKAAKKSESKVKSSQSIKLKKISVNNGEYEGLFEFITPIMSKLLANNSKDKDGITGGYKKLVASDAASAKAYKTGNNIAIEMVMREQVSGLRDDALEGSVGHAITAVGDISVVTDQLKDLGLPLELSDRDSKIYYTKPIVKVLINSKGEIVNGTWRYTVDISINNYKAFGKAVETTSVVMENTITVNGGFRK